MVMTLAPVTSVPDFGILAPVRSDTLPENTRYKDDGCDVSSTCLDCPLPLCKYDDPGWLQRESRRTRDDEIFGLREKRVPVAEISQLEMHHIYYVITSSYSNPGGRRRCQSVASW